MEKKRINFLAIRSIRPTGEFGIDETYSTLTWFDWNTEKKPTEKEVTERTNKPTPSPTPKQATVPKTTRWQRRRKE